MLQNIAIKFILRCCTLIHDTRSGIGTLVVGFPVMRCDGSYFLGDLWPLELFWLLAIFLNICLPLERIPFFFLGVSSPPREVPFGVLSCSKLEDDES